eukprot:s2030_g4.t1
MSSGIESHWLSPDRILRKTAVSGDPNYSAPKRLRVIRIFFDSVVVVDNPNALIRIYPKVLESVCKDAEANPHVYYPWDTGTGDVEVATTHRVATSLAPGIPVRAVCQVHRVSDSLVKRTQIVMLHPAFADAFYSKPGGLEAVPYVEELTRFHVFCDGIYADSQEKPSAARARRERRKRQGTVQTPIVPDIVEDAKRKGGPGMGGHDTAQEEDLSLRCEALRIQLDRFQASEAVGMVWPLSRHSVGCRLIQRALEVTPASFAEQLVMELRGHVKDAASSPHANYVLQKVITQLRPHASSFIAEELLDSGARFARHRFGCRILCRLLEHCTTEGSTQRLISKILEDPSEALELCRHNFGHHVVQLVLERGHPRHKELVLQVLYKDLATNAAHRRASYVVEAALNNCSPQDQYNLLHHLLQPSVLYELSQARYGLYVVKTLLKRPEVDANGMARAIPAVAEIMKKIAANPVGDEVMQITPRHPLMRNTEIEVQIEPWAVRAANLRDQERYPARWTGWMKEKEQTREIFTFKTGSPAGVRADIPVTLTPVLGISGRFQ